MKCRDGNAVERWFEAVFDFIDRRAIMKRVMTLGTFVVVIEVIMWSMWFAQTSPRSGVEISVILAAIMVPLNGLMGYMFGQYVQGPRSEGPRMERRDDDDRRFDRQPLVPPAASPTNVTVNN